MRQTRKHNATIFFHAVAVFAVAGCSPAPTAEEKGREVGAKIDKSINKAEKKIDEDLDKVKSELSGAKSDIERWIDKADKASDAAASEFKK
jgi:outer membrane murein-binding lipoprotein Lpp